MTPRSGRFPFLPQALVPLEELVLNLNWRWNRPARAFLRTELDPQLWNLVRHNPVALLRSMEPGRLAELAEDPDFVARLQALTEGAEGERAREDTWFRRTFPELGPDPVAYFCAEFGLHSSLRIYSGGLGVLAGDHCKSASDLGIPFVGVGLLYARGYFDQKLNLEGWQESAERVFDLRSTPLVRIHGPGGAEALAHVETGSREVAIGAWKVEVGRISLVLLDTNLEVNHPDDRALTSQLYGGGKEYRLKQEWILGVGGVRVLRTLGISPGAWHANEGHATFMMVERVRELVSAGRPYAEALDEVRRHSVFTTHTPVPAGHDMFDRTLVEEVCGAYRASLDGDPDTFHALGHHPRIDHGTFHMTAAGLRLAGHVNGVSRLHAQVTRELWRPLWPGLSAEAVPVRGVTNGVHLGSWMSHRFMNFLEGHLGLKWEERTDDPELWRSILDLDDAAIWEIHTELRHELLDFCREESRWRWKEFWKEAAHLVGAGSLLSPEPLTIGFARRFATYKRAHLLFRDEDRLARLLTNPRRPVQLVFAGKAHPADDEAKRVLQRVWQATRDARYEGRIAFLEDFELHLAHRMVQGVDLWLNIPRVPMEASGTSGMKAALNGVPQLSTLDGWWAEGFTGRNGWAIARSEGSDEAMDARDHEALFTLLEQEVVPLFYDRDEAGLPRGWIQVMKHAMMTAGLHFTTDRMVRDYARDLYAPALRGDALEHPAPFTPRFEGEPAR